MNGLIIIPAFQAGRYLGNVLKDIIKGISFPGDILVVNDGSSDETEVVAKSFGVYVLSHKNNLGKGAALISGFDFAVRNNYEFVICMDADGQHDPKFVPDFISAYEAGEYDLIIGSRQIVPGKIPFDRYLSNAFTSVVVSLVAGRRIHDSQSGYRLLTVNLIRKLRLQTHQYETETEILLQGIRKYQARVGEVPISVTYSGEKSHINRLTDTLRFVKIVLKILGSF